MNDEVKHDFDRLEEDDRGAQAVIVGDLGERFAYASLNPAFRLLMAGAELVALQKNRYWLREDGLSLDVGPFVAALEYAAGATPTWSESRHRASSPRSWRSYGCTPERRSWSATTSRAISAERWPPGWRRFSSARASSAEVQFRPRASIPPPRSTRSRICPGC